MKIGYARCSTDRQDLTAQREALAGLGCDPARVYLDEGYTGTNRKRPHLAEALAACRSGDTFVVTKLDRLARSVPDARAMLDELAAGGVRFQMGGSVYDWADPFGRMFLQMLAVIAEFEADLISMRTREGMAVAKARGRLRGGKPKLSPAQERHLVKLREAGETSIGELAELFSVSRPTVYRALERAGTRPPA
jgi:DNA invertase Pin-like site-specific DNA recombinase